MPTIFKFIENEKEVYKLRDGTIVKDPAILDYIKKLVIPRAYNSVEIYYQANGKEPKIKYMGIDAAGRPQFIYSKKWSEKARHTKLCNLVHFGEELPKIMARMEQHMKADRMTKNKIIATILRIISLCYFRVGNIKYENLYSSHGISTLTKKHVRFTNEGIRISFIGKKGVLNEGIITDPITAQVLRDLYHTRTDDVHLFTYDGQHIKHTDVNDWLKEFNPIFTSKMFRTFDANTLLIDELNKADEPKKLTAPQRKRAVVAALKVVSEKVHNTPAICKKSYSDIDMIDMYLTKPIRWAKYFRTPSSSTRIKFINYLRDHCTEEEINRAED